MNDTDVGNLLAFALSGAGFDNFDPIVGTWDDDYINQLSIWFTKWRAERDISEFYSFLLEDAGYKCEDVSFLNVYR